MHRARRFSRWSAPCAAGGAEEADDDRHGPSAKAAHAHLHGRSMTLTAAALSGYERSSAARKPAADAAAIVAVSVGAASIVLVRRARAVSTAAILHAEGAPEPGRLVGTAAMAHTAVTRTTAI